VPWQSQPLYGQSVIGSISLRIPAGMLQLEGVSMPIKQ